MSEDITAVSVEERNRQFEQMSDAEKRVTLAKDILTALGLDRFRPWSTYILNAPENEWEVFENGAARESSEPCLACGIGAFWLAYSFRTGTRLRERVLLRPYRAGDGNVMLDQLEAVISRKQLRLIECAFEVTYYDDWSKCEEGITIGESKQAAMFTIPGGWEAFQRFLRSSETRVPWPSNSERLRLILENFIANGGEFIP